MAFLPGCPHSQFSRGACSGTLHAAEDISLLHSVHLTPALIVHSELPPCGQERSPVHSPPTALSHSSASPPAAATELPRFLQAHEHAAKQNMTPLLSEGLRALSNRKRGNQVSVRRDQQLASKIVPGLLCNSAMGQLTAVPPGTQKSPRPPLQLKRGDHRARRGMRSHYYPLHSYGPVTFTSAKGYKTAQTHAVTQFAFSAHNDDKSFFY